MANILFIYGYGGSPESKFCTLIRKALSFDKAQDKLNSAQALPADEYEVFCPVYPQEDCAKAHEFLLDYIDENGIDMIIGTSLGGFIALTLDTNLPTVVLNPCMVPSVELPLLKPREDHPDDVLPSPEMIATYKPFEPDAFSNESYKRRFVMGLFAENDELLGSKYKQRFIDTYDVVRSMPGGHHGNAEAIPTIVDAIELCLAPESEIDNWYEFMCELKMMSPLNGTMNFDHTKYLWLWRKLQKSKSGDVVIRIIEGGNRVMKLGCSQCGFTPGLIEGVPIVIGFPDGGYYQGGVIHSIDWENETFKTAQSTYSFHFVRR